MHLREAIERAAPTRWVGDCGETSCGKGFLKFLQFPQQAVVLGIRNGGLVQDVVAVVMPSISARSARTSCRLQLRSRQAP